MDEVRIWNDVRDPSEITTFMGQKVDPGSEPNLVAYYDFDLGIPEGDNSTETTLTDLTSNGFDGTLNGPYDLTNTNTTSNWIQSGAFASLSAVSVQTGNWGDPNTWDTGFVPGSGTDVTIDVAHTVTLDVSPDVAGLQVDGTLVTTGFNLNISGDFTGTGTITTGASDLITFDGDNQNVSSASVLNHVLFAGSGFKSLSGGSFSVNDFTVNTGVTVNTGGTDITVAGDWVANTGSNFNHGNNTVTFTGPGSVNTILPFYNVTFGSTGAISVTSILLTVEGNVNFSIAADVDFGNTIVSVEGDWNVPDDITLTYGPTGAVAFTGDVPQTIEGPFPSLSFSGNTGQVITFSNTLIADGDLTIGTDTQVNTADFDIIVGGNFSNLGTFPGGFGNGTLSLNATSVNNYAFTSGGLAFNNISINSPGSTYTLIDNLTNVSGASFTLTDGTMNLNGQTMDLVGGSLGINGGRFEINASADLNMANTGGIVVNNGVFSAVGSSGLPATVAVIGGSGSYTFTQSGGTLEVDEYVFSNLGGQGIDILAGGISATYNFSNGTFSAGSGTQYISDGANALAGYTISNVVFDAGPTNNVSKLSGGVVTFLNSSGALGGDVNGPANENDGGAFIEWATQTDNALAFDGVNDHVLFPSGGGLPLYSAAASDFTIEMWIKGVSQSATYIYMEANSASSTVPHMWLEAVNGNIRVFKREDGAIPVYSHTTTATVLDDNWHHIAWVDLGSAGTPNVKVYVDGVLDIDENYTLGSYSGTIDEITLGAFNRDAAPSNFFVGQVDEMRLWNLERNASEIQSSLATTLTTESGLVASFDFNHGIAGGPNSGVTTLIDITGSGNDGSLNGPFDLTNGNTTSNWVLSGAFAVTVPEIAVEGNATDITSGDNTPDVADDTDFGATIPGAPIVKTYTIRNTGLSNLILTDQGGGQYVTLSGNNAEFTVTSQPGNVIAPGATETFDITFSAIPFNLYLATVNIQHNDPDDPESPFTFDISADVLAAPGGVVTGLISWLKADAGVTGTTTVSTWDDQSGNGNGAVDPSTVGPELLPGHINYNPALNFALNEGLVMAATLNTAPYTVSIVYNTNGVSTPRRAIQSASINWLIGPYSGGHNHFANGWVTSSGPTVSQGLSVMASAVNTGSTSQFYVEGVDVTLNNTFVSAPGQLFLGGDIGFSPEDLDGDIAEVIVYDASINFADQQKLDSYLGIKYGISLLPDNDGDLTTFEAPNANGIHEGDYVVSDGTVIWDASVNSSHNNDIAFIGRDDASALNQKQSHSINSDWIVAMGLGTIELDNQSNAATFPTDLSFLGWANDNAAPDQASATNSNIPAGVIERMTRVWKVEENNGDVGNVTVQFDITGFGYTPTSGQEYALLIDDDGVDFSNAVVIDGNDFNSDIVEFNGVNLADGDFFTLATQIPNIALNFDGINDFVDAGSDGSLYGHSNLTIEGWINPDYTNITSEGVIVSTHAIGSAGAGYQMSLQTDGTIVILYRDNTFTNRLVISTQSLSAGTWHHVAGVVENAGANSNIYLYINGQLEGSLIGATGVPDYTNASNLFIGSNGDGVAGGNGGDREFGGNMDELRIWSVARSAAEIKQNAYNTLTSGTGLVASYDFETGIPDGNNAGQLILNDISPNINNGLLADGSGDGGASGFLLNGPTSNWVTSNAFVNEVFAPLATAGSIQALGETTTSIDISGQLDEPANVHYVVLLDGVIPAPSSAQVQAGQDGNGDPAALGFATIGTQPDFSFTATIGSLTESTNYDIYIVAEDLDGNLQANPTLLDASTVFIGDVTFTTLPVPAPGDVPVGSSDNIIYKFRIDVTNADVDWTGAVFELTGTMEASDFETNGFDLLSNNTDNFVGATSVGTATFGNQGGNRTGVVFSNTVTAGTSQFYWLTADIAAGAAFNSFSVQTPVDSDFGFAVSNKDLTNIAAGSTFNITANAINVASIALIDAATNNLAAVNWTVEFDGSIVGLTTGNFAVLENGITGSAVVGVSGSGTSYVVTASTGTGDGTLILEVANSAGTTPAIGNIPYNAETEDQAVYTLDRSVPTATVEFQNPDTGSADGTSSDNLVYTITFSEPIDPDSFTADDIIIEGAGITFSSIEIVDSGDGTTFTVTIVGVAGEGGLMLSIGTEITDVAGNAPEQATQVEQQVQLDNTAPTIEITSEADEIILGPQLIVQITASEAIRNFEPEDFTLSSGIIVSELTTDDDSLVWSATIDEIDFDEFSVFIAADVLTDRAGNQNIVSNTLERFRGPHGVVESDSLALIQLFQNTNGENWVNNTGWGFGELLVKDWFGITVERDRVVGINLASNDLIGGIGSELTPLDALLTLDLSDNEIIGLPDLTSLTNLTSANVTNNKLEFASLEPNVGINNINFNPQKEVLELVDALFELDNAIQIGREIRGTEGTVTYTWFKDDVVLDGETNPILTIENVGFDDEGEYSVEATSSIVAGLVLRSTKFVVKVSSLERDIAALTNIYNATGGPEGLWVNDANWLSADVTTWFGVTVTNNRVTGLALPNNGLQNQMPVDLKDLGSVTTIDLSGNELRGLPDMRSLSTSLTSLNVVSNRLGYKSIELNLSVPGFQFDPQRRYGVTTESRLQIGESFELRIDITGDNNRYQWFRKPRRTPEDVPGTPIPGATRNRYVVDNIDFDNMGIFYVEVTSPLVTQQFPDFKIRNRNQQVLAVTDMFGTTFIDPVAGTIMNQGDVIAFEISKPGEAFFPFDTVTLSNSGQYFLDDVVLGDYILVGRAGGEFAEDVLQTYYKKVENGGGTNDWLEADTVFLREVVSGIDIDMIAIPPPFISDPNDPNFSDAFIGGFFEVDIPEDKIDEESGRVKAARRVRRAGVSLNRARAKQRGKQEVVIELVAYFETNDNGEFQFPNVPPGDYLLNIQFPGLPMDPDSFIEYTIDENMEGQSISVSALGTPSGITVTEEEVTGFYRRYFKNLTLYPNPATDVLNIVYEKLNSANLEAQLLDLSGQLLLKTDLEKGRLKAFEMDVSELKPGIYLMNFVDKDENFFSVATFRIVIER